MAEFMQENDKVEDQLVMDANFLSKGPELEPAFEPYEDLKNDDKNDDI